MNALYKDAAWQKSMQLKLDFNGMMKQFVGEHGLDPDELNKNKEMYDAAAASMAAISKFSSGR